MRNAARSILWVFLVFICVSASHVVGGTKVAAQAGPPVDKASIGGTVTNTATGKPEAGVWVIAETKLAVPYRKIVVTDDQGRFLAPDLPTASYDVRRSSCRWPAPPRRRKLRRSIRPPTGRR